MDVWNRWFYNTRLVASGRFVMERGNTKQEILDALVQEVLEQYEGNMTPSFSAEESTHRALPGYLS